MTGSEVGLFFALFWGPTNQLISIDSSYYPSAGSALKLYAAAVGNPYADNDTLIGSYTVKGACEEHKGIALAGNHPWQKLRGSGSLSDLKKGASSIRARETLWLADGETMDSGP